MNRINKLNRRLFLGGLASGAATPLFAQSNPKQPSPSRKTVSPRVLSPGVYVQEIPSGVRPIQEPETSATLFIDVFGGGALETVTSLSQFQTHFGTLPGASEAALETVALYFRNGGRKALIASIGDASPASILGAPDAGGVRSFLGGAALNIDFICAPPASALAAGEASIVYSEALLLAEEQKAMLLLDAPAGPGFDANGFIADWLGALGINHPNAAIYAPRLQVAGVVPTLPASAAAAGIATRIDAARGVWKAPAGMEATVRGATPTAALSSADNEILNQANANAIRSFANVGPVLWGARTLSTDPEWKYIPVRRTALFIEKSLDDGLQWTVFEPNEEPLWKQIEMAVGNYLQVLFRKGAFTGATPKEAYFVRCDRTTTQADIDRGVCNVEIGFAPLKPAEFVIIRRELRTAS
ncbi:phage tail sheath family protein [Hyphococcus luteus]|nr:phage tail sheath C-terminal domain-containing protein [Marinicaulis flavus]